MLTMEQHIQSYLRHAASRGRTTQHIGPFLATFTDYDANPFLNYAIPDDGATPTPADIADLVAAFRQHARTPRLEYLPSIAPAVEAPLLAAGFAIEEHMPLMVCPPGAVQAIPVPPSIELVVPQTDADLAAMIAAQNAAYGEATSPTPEAIARRRAFLDAGGSAILARDLHTGDGVGGGICDVPYLHTTELTSVGVIATYRRRGIAAALTARLAQVAFDAGTTTVFLMAAHAAEARIYARVGFIPIGEVLAMTLP
jgi:GNAT superfamily N-acetyltransferase